MLQFLRSRNLSHLLNSFILSKIDDTVAGDADTTKLMNLDLVHGDIISYRQMFPSNSTPKSGVVQRKSSRVKNEDPENPFRTNTCDETTDPY